MKKLFLFLILSLSFIFALAFPHMQAAMAYLTEPICYQVMRKQE